MNALRKYSAEFLGTFTLVFIAAGAVCADYYLRKTTGQGFGIIGTSLAFGLATASVIYAISHISGAHINPAITIAHWITQRINPNTAIKYILSQLLGASLAGFTLKMLFPEALYTIYLGSSSLGDEVSTHQGIIMEFIISFLLALTIYGTLDKRAYNGFAGLAIGLVVLFGALVGGPISGGIMNPARAFGPAIASGQFTHHYIWWIGPIIGSIAAALLYDAVLAENGEKK
ncbi:MAG: MIP/aquaporin family protein [Candidatus Loosdrechtia sp.]|uniref:MIP/aquaporin family protein n=1 Tax=Candidatus Loosdrechtia sp. TaxID=3101272 RepID=UPI003A6AD885|nr:MAG: MIP/aquaporin family protein [Candidatus Jettenia sp. AMX2]